MGYNVEVMHYKTPEVELGNKSIEELGRMESIVTRRYPSQTYENFIANWENFEAVDATIPKSYIVVLRKGHTAERFGNKFESIRRHLGEDPNQSKITEIPDMYVEIASTHEVAYIQRAQFFKMSVPSPWGLSRISKRDQHLYLSPYQCPGNEGENVVVYVMDSGVDIRNPEFENRATCPPLANFAAGCHPVTDEHGHGTHVAAIIGGIRYGVAKKATIISVKVFDGITQINGSESESGILAGIDWVIKNIGHQKAKVGFVVNMSFSGPHSLYMNDLVELLFKKNVPVIVAAGNDPNRNTVNASPSGAPGAYTVAAMGQNNNPYDSNSWGRRVNIFAPGVNITSAWIGGLDMTLDGTSAAAAHVTGVAALYLSDNRYLTAQDLYDSLTNNATKGVIQGDLGGSPNLVAFNRAHSHTRLPFHNWFQSLLKL
ncbi:Basic amino-acid permease [Podila minutissima]|nr:Basic amino-acid permease [Podila minutissima]